MNISKLFSRFTFGPLLIFISVMLVYYFHINNTSIHFIPTANYSIDIVLKNLETCESYDSTRQRVLLRLLHGWTQFAHEHKLQYWLAYGTLVGYVQSGGLIPHDRDIDVLMLPSDTERLVPFGDTNFSTLFNLKVHPQWFIVEESNRSYFPSQGISFKAPNARFKDQEYGNHVDIFPVYDFHPGQPRHIKHLKKNLTLYDNGYDWISSPIEWTFPLKPCIFSGIQTWCPAKPEKIVAMLYGSEAVNQTNYVCVNHTWVHV